MEGKCVLFKEFAGVDAFPIIVGTQDTEEFIQTVKNIADTFKITARVYGDYPKPNGAKSQLENVDFARIQNAYAFERTYYKYQANKQFEQAYYPNKNHGIYGGNTRLHLFTLMTNFLLQNL